MLTGDPPKSPGEAPCIFGITVWMESLQIVAKGDIGRGVRGRKRGSYNSWKNTDVAQISFRRMDNCFTSQTYGLIAVGRNWTRRLSFIVCAASDVKRRNKVVGKSSASRFGEPGNRPSYSSACTSDNLSHLSSYRRGRRSRRNTHRSCRDDSLYESGKNELLAQSIWNWQNDTLLYGVTPRILTSFRACDKEGRRNTFYLFILFYCDQ